MERRVHEILVGMIFLVLVFSMILIGIGTNSNEKVVVNNVQADSVSPGKVYLRSYSNEPIYQRSHSSNYIPGHHYYFQQDYKNSQVTVQKNQRKEVINLPAPEYKDNTHETKQGFSTWSQYSKKNNFGLFTDTYKVYVKNHGESRYFRINYEFRDMSGHARQMQERKYISNEDTGVFYYRDISKNRDAYYTWDYEIN